MATIVASIEYLVHEILLRLPVKSVLRFKCVSKQWLALISEPKFCHSHTLRLYKSSRVFPSAILLPLVSSTSCPIIPIKTNDVSDSSNFRNVEVPKGTVIQSCNGLILIKRCTSKPWSKVEYFICNPTTNKSVPVVFPTEDFGYSLVSLFICFDPLKSQYYKLVSVRYKYYTSGPYWEKKVISYNPEAEYVCNVYSSETDAWIESGFTFTASDSEPPRKNNAVYHDGVLYCYMFRLGKFCYFDFDTLSFKTCPMPVSIDENSSVLYFGESGGYLLFVLRSRLQIEILKLKVEKLEFSLVSNVKKRESFFRNEICKGNCVFIQEKDKDTGIVSFRRGMVMSINVAASSFKVLSRFSSGRRPTLVTGVFQHCENLSCVGPFKV
ncbi:hypothetical protein TanjilG_01550 [Lupinus angustifolius]|uniref:F-box protein At5g07610-like n=1 Tax=Lupinus angustifolius TaxID=3871 RepID=UPI00090E52A3|nr:PREDICTED: F-box protein At5g07610-like [Lupinus angustifolius]OIV90096.1 hypothetical protein TanjilG_01550 [Lupinus angustifolius]